MVSKVQLTVKALKEEREAYHNARDELDREYVRIQKRMYWLTMLTPFSRKRKLDYLRDTYETARERIQKVYHLRCESLYHPEKDADKCLNTSKASQQQLLSYSHCLAPLHCFTVM